MGAALAETYRSTRYENNRENQILLRHSDLPHWNVPSLVRVSSCLLALHLQSTRTMSDLVYELVGGPCCGSTREIPFAIPSGAHTAFPRSDQEHKANPIYEVYRAEADEVDGDKKYTLVYVGEEEV